MQPSLKSPVIILANGAFPTQIIPLELLEDAGTVICTDGAANKLAKLDLIPHVIIGDLDSIDPDYQFHGMKIHDPNQENTDLDKALDWAIMNGIESVNLLGATGLRDDMTMANHIILFDYFEKINIEMVTDHFTITCHIGQNSFNSFPGEVVSLFPRDYGTVVSTTALKYPLNEIKIDPSTRALSNQSLGASFSVDASGPILVFRGHPQN